MLLSIVLVKKNITQVQGGRHLDLEMEFRLDVGGGRYQSD